MSELTRVYAVLGKEKPRAGRAFAAIGRRTDWFATKRACKCFTIMLEDGKAENLRRLLRTAKGLRTIAAETVDPAESDLYLRGALVLEARAEKLAFGGADTPQMDIRARVDVRC